MINNLYQKTLNDIADYSYEKMKFLNTLFANWKQKMVDLQKTVDNKLFMSYTTSRKMKF